MQGSLLFFPSFFLYVYVCVCVLEAVHMCEGRHASAEANVWRPADRWWSVLTFHLICDRVASVLPNPGWQLKSCRRLVARLLFPGGATLRLKTLELLRPALHVALEDLNSDCFT